MTGTRSSLRQSISILRTTFAIQIQECSRSKMATQNTVTISELNLNHMKVFLSRNSHPSMWHFHRHFASSFSVRSPSCQKLRRFWETSARGTFCARPLFSLRSGQGGRCWTENRLQTIEIRDKSRNTRSIHYL